MSDFDPQAVLEIDAELLYRIVKCVGMIPEQVAEPSYFTEFVRVSKVANNNRVHIMATDGFRMHLIEGDFDAHFDTEEAWFPIPAGWLIDNVPDFRGRVTFNCERRTSNWYLTVSYVRDTGHPISHVLTFNTDPATWPINMARLFASSKVEDKTVGFNVDYLSDAFKALKIWRPVGDDPAVLPMAVEALSDKSFSRFSIKNEHGVLVTIVMPVLVDPDELPKHHEDGPDD